MKKSTFSLHINFLRQILNNWLNQDYNVQEQTGSKHKTSKISQKPVD